MVPPILLRNFLLAACYSCCFFAAGLHSVAHFCVKSVGARSVVIEMVDALNVSRFDMRVLIYDLEKLREFRRSELTGARYNAQLFSFDGLLPANWFAFRIEYRLIFRVRPEMRTSIFDQQQQQMDNDLTTKQEMIVRTRTELLSSFAGGKDQTSNEASDIEDEVVQFDRVQLFPELHQLNLTLSPVFTNRPRINTLLVAELQCARTTIKPQAQQLPDAGTVFSFDLKRVHAEALAVERQMLLKVLNCSYLCVFPFVRVEPPPKSSEHNALSMPPQQRYTFRAREICESLLQDEDANEADGPSRLDNAKIGKPQSGWPNARHKMLDRRFSRTATNDSTKMLFWMRTIFVHILFIIIAHQFFMK